MSKILTTAIIAGLLFGVTAPAFAADPPKNRERVRKAERHEVGRDNQGVRKEVS